MFINAKKKSSMVTMLWTQYKQSGLLSLFWFSLCIFGDIPSLKSNKTKAAKVRKNTTHYCIVKCSSYPMPSTCYEPPVPSSFTPQTSVMPQLTLLLVLLHITSLVSWWTCQTTDQSVILDVDEPVTEDQFPHQSLTQCVVLHLKHPWDLE